jgi:hypothetical protein
MGSLSQIARVNREKSGDSILADEGKVMNTGSSKSQVSYEAITGVSYEI